MISLSIFKQLVRSFSILNLRNNTRNPIMTSVLNVGVMQRNPVGNQIRSLQTLLDAEKKNTQFLLSALESKMPEVFSEYTRLKNEVSDAVQVEQQRQQQQQVTQRFPQQQARNPGGRF